MASKKERLRNAFYALRLRPECRCNKEVFQGRFQGSRAALSGAGAGRRVAGDVLRETGTATSTPPGVRDGDGVRLRAGRRVAGDGDLQEGSKLAQNDP